MGTFLTVLRTILGLLYFVFGVNGFLQFLPGVSFPGVRAEHFYLSLEESGYILPMIYIASLVSGTSLLLNLFVAFFLLLFLPVTINFSLFYYYLGDQILLAPEMFVPITLNLVHIVLILAYYHKYRGLLKPR